MHIVSKGNFFKMATSDFYTSRKLHLDCNQGFQSMLKLSSWILDLIFQNKQIDKRKRWFSMSDIGGLLGFNL